MAEAQMIEGCPVIPRLDFIYVADYAQPNRTRGGIYLPKGAAFDYPSYRFDIWRYGEVIAIGPGRPATDKRGREKADGTLRPMPDLKLGDVVMFSRKHGGRTGLRYKHPVLTTKRYALDDTLSGLLIRIIDPNQCQAVIEDFEPWWDPEECTPVSPSQIMSG